MGCGRGSDRDVRNETDVSTLSTGAGFASPSSCPFRVPSNATVLSGTRCAELGKAARRAVSLWHWRPSISVTARRVLPTADDHDGMRLFCCFMHDRWQGLGSVFGFPCLPPCMRLILAPCSLSTRQPLPRSARLSWKGASLPLRSSCAGIFLASPTMPRLNGAPGQSQDGSRCRP
jgi:hypothetical protein